jgi:hypothetical protein
MSSLPLVAARPLAVAQQSPIVMISISSGEMAPSAKQIPCALTQRCEIKIGGFARKMK